MQAFCRVAFLDLAWRASLGTASALGLMYVYRADPPTALMIGAHVAMLFAAVMIVYASLLTERSVEYSDPWLELAPHERPSDNRARRRASAFFAWLMLRFARGAAAIGAGLAAAALFLSA